MIPLNHASKLAAILGILHRIYLNKNIDYIRFERGLTVKKYMSMIRLN
jgi:hypothetical protein